MSFVGLVGCGVGGRVDIFKRSYERGKNVSNINKAFFTNGILIRTSIP